MFPSIHGLFFSSTFDSFFKISSFRRTNKWTKESVYKCSAGNHPIIYPSISGKFKIDRNWRTSQVYYKNTIYIVLNLQFQLYFRSPVWGFHNDYPQSTGHGIGSFLSIKECKISQSFSFTFQNMKQNEVNFSFPLLIAPINIAYTEPYSFSFEDGYFFSNGN